MLPSLKQDQTQKSQNRSRSTTPLSSQLKKNRRKIDRSDHSARSVSASPEVTDTQLSHSQALPSLNLARPRQKRPSVFRFKRRDGTNSWETPEEDASVNASKASTRQVLDTYSWAVQNPNPHNTEDLALKLTQTPSPKAKGAKNFDTNDSDGEVPSLVAAQKIKKMVQSPTEPQEAKPSHTDPQLQVRKSKQRSGGLHFESKKGKVSTSINRSPKNTEPQQNPTKTSNQDSHPYKKSAALPNASDLQPSDANPKPRAIERSRKPLPSLPDTPFTIDNLPHSLIKAYGPAGTTKLSGLDDKIVEKRVKTASALTDSKEIKLSRKKEWHLGTGHREGFLHMIRNYRDDLAWGLDSSLDSLSSPESLSKTQNGEPKNSTMNYIRRCEQLGLTPEPMGIFKTSAPFSKDVIEFKSYSMGDTRASALSEVLSFMPRVQNLNLRSNRLTGPGTAAILSRISNKLTKLDLSSNSIGVEGCRAVAESISTCHQLVDINLERNSLCNDSGIILARALVGSNSIVTCRLGFNNLGDFAATAIGEALQKNTTLKELYLPWNRLRARGIISIAEGLAINKSVVSLDLSWNGFGSNHADVSSQAAFAIANAIRTNTTLTHLDLSHDRLTVPDCQEISEALRVNRTIQGLHIGGNAAYIDGRGFLVPKNESPEEKESNMESIQQRNRDTELSLVEDPRILSRILGYPELPNGPMWRSDSNCWICQKWQLHKFEWIPGRSGPSAKTIYVHPSFDDWQPDIMQRDQESGIWILYRMAPPGPLLYYFSLEMAKSAYDPPELAVAADHSIISSGKDTQRLNIKLPPASVTSSFNIVYIEQCNHSVKFGAIAPEEKPVPRHPRPKIRVVLRPKSPWNISKSVFATYQMDTTTVLDNAFQRDWNHGKIPNFVKDPEDLEEVQRLLRKHFTDLCCVHKYYAPAASGSSDPFNISWNSFTDMMNKCRIPDDDTCMLKDLDTIFIATNVSKVKSSRNPDRALTRFELLEAFVRVAAAKYIKSGKCTKHSEALQLLLQDHIFPYAERASGDEFRREILHTEDIDKVFKMYRSHLQELYSQCSGFESRPGEKKYMSVNEFIRLLTASRLIDDDFTSREATFAFLWSIHTVVDTIETDDYRKMMFVEFLESLCRVAVTKDLSYVTEEYLSFSNVPTTPDATTENCASDSDEESSISQAMNATALPPLWKVDGSLTIVGKLLYVIRCVLTFGSNLMKTRRRSISLDISPIGDPKQLAPPSVLKRKNSMVGLLNRRSSISKEISSGN